MSIDNLLYQSLEIRRAPLTAPGTTDDWNQPGYGADATVATVRGRIEPLAMDEVALLTDAGAQIGDFRIYMGVTDVVTGDRIRIATTTEQYEVRQKLAYPAMNAIDHLELIVRRVID